jgi:hypothetical protein
VRNAPYTPALDIKNNFIKYFHLVFKMNLTTAYIILFCCLISNNKGLGFRFQHKLYEHARNSLDHERRAITSTPGSVSNIHNLNHAYAKDNYYVYYLDKKLDVTSVSSFKALDSGYAKDNYNVYYLDKKLDVTSASSFTTLGSGYAKDNYNVYYAGKKLNVVSASSFSLLK